MDVPDLRNPNRPPHINFRIFLFCAAGLCFGIFLCSYLVFGWLRPSLFLVPVLLLFLTLFPFSWRRTAAFALCILLFGGAGAGLFSLYTERYQSGLPEGEYTVEGTVRSVTVRDGYSDLVLFRLSSDGDRVKGKLTVTLPTQSLRPADKLTLHINLTRIPLPASERAVSDFAENIRYNASASSWEKTGTSADLFLRLNAAIYDALHDNMEREPAEVGYALLTGNSGAVDGGILSAVRAGGIAHVFAVSGLHIGIAYGAALALFRLIKPIKKYAFLPASLLAFAYCGVCGFTVSSLRAAVMSLVLGSFLSLGRKYDLISSLSFAGTITLLVSPAQFLSAGFRLSYCAVLALALFANPLTRALCRLRIPRSAAQAVAATLSVQLVTFPLLYELYGYVSLWGFLLNPLLIPLLPVLFLTLLVCTMLSVVIPPAAPFFCLFPSGLLSLFLLFLAVTDFSAVLTGFALGAGGCIWFCGAVLLSERVNFKGAVRCGLAALSLLVFAVTLFVNNLVPVGCTIEVHTGKRGGLALFRTNEETVLVVGGDVSYSDCTLFLQEHYLPTLDAVLFLSDESASLAPFLGAEQVFFGWETGTGTRETNCSVSRHVGVGCLDFCFEEEEKMSVTVGGLVGEIDFSGDRSLDADFFLGRERTDLKYFLYRDIIYTL